MHLLLLLFIREDVQKFHLTKALIDLKISQKFVWKYLACFAHHLLWLSFHQIFLLWSDWVLHIYVPLEVYAQNKMDPYNNYTETANLSNLHNKHIFLTSQFWITIFLLIKLPMLFQKLWSSWRLNIFTMLKFNVFKRFRW